jgi:RHS repeat-associated protein
MAAPYICETRRGPDGRIVEKIETVRGRKSAWTYAYDSGGRLAEAKLDGRLICQCWYDREGRRMRDYLPATAGANYRDYRYTPDNRLMRAGGGQYSHDERGFRSIWSDKGVYTLYEYAPDYRLLKAEEEDRDKVFTFAHDEDGQRVAKYLNGQLVEAYQWLDFVRLAAFYDGHHQYEFAYHDGERTPFAMRRDDGVVAGLFYDQVGSLRVVADMDGNVIKEVLYDPFGGIIEDTNPDLRLPLGFAGGLHDRDLGFVRFGWRDYDVRTGRWTAPDPIGEQGGDPDWYGYCLDDPVNGVDPLGLFRFGKKGLWILPGIGTDGSTADKGNYELKHEHGFYEDGTGDNVGLFKDGLKRDQDITKYKLDETHFDDKRMRQAEESLDPGDYKLCKWGGKSNNCQDYADALRERYRFLRTAEKH